MADNQEEQNPQNEPSSSNWSWNSWLSAAKNKSVEVLEFVKKDLEEFGTAVKNEASSMVSTTSNVLEKTLKLDDMESAASTMKRSFSSFLGQMNTVLNPSPDDSDTEAVVITQDNETVPLTKLQKAIYELQNDPDTFLKDPEPSLKAQYQCWLEIITDQLTEDRLAKHLTSSEILNDKYLTLCPDSVTHDMFWKRYLFKKALLEDSMAHQEVIDKRELEKKMAEENMKWDQDDFASNVELTEEEQIKLLEQYEKETKQRQLITPAEEPVLVKEEEEKQKEKKPIKKDVPTKNTKKNTQVQKSNIKKSPEKNLSKKNEKVVTPPKTPSQTSLNSEKSSTETSASSLDGEWEKL